MAFNTSLIRYENFQKHRIRALELIGVIMLVLFCSRSAPVVFLFSFFPFYYSVRMSRDMHERGGKHL